MQSMQLFLAGWLITVQIALSTSAMAQETTEAAEVAELKAENAALRDENTALRKQVSTLTADLETLRERLGDLEQNNEELNKQADVLEQQTTQLQALAGIASDEEKSTWQFQRIRSAHQESDDTTTVSFGPEELEARGSAGEFYFALSYRHAGQEQMAAVDTVTLSLHGYRTGRLFHKQETAEFLINGQARLLPITKLDLTPRKVGAPGRTQIDRSDEAMEFKIDRKTLVRLGEAKSLSVRRKRIEIKFDRDDLAAMRAVAQRMDRQ